MPYVWFLTICAIWGSSFILMKRAAICLSPVAVGAGRVLLGAAVMALVWRSLKEPLRVRRQDAAPLLVVVILGFAWPYCLQPELIARHGSAFVGMTVGFTPLLTLALSAAVLRTPVTARQLLGVLGALGCLCLLMWDGWQREIPVGDLSLAFSVPATYSIANVLIRRMLQHVPPVELTCLCLGVSGAVLLPGALWLPGPSAAITESVGILEPWLALTVLGVLGTGVATCLFNRLVQDQGPLFAAMVTNLVPLGALCWGWADAEEITFRQFLAVMGVLAMVVLVQYGAVRKNRETGIGT
jgi:drug/metabolite transporter (DMT)-like permease